MLDYDKFFNGMEDIYAAFGKKMPEDKIVQAIYKRVKTLPDAFMDFALKCLEDEEKLPQNLGRYLFRNLWPEYLALHPELKAIEDIACCSKCAPDMPGYRKVWQPELVLGQEDYTPRIIRCTCGNAPNPKKEPIFTDDQLLNMGWLIKSPYADKYPTMPGKWRNVIGKEGEMRQEHKEYLARQEGLEIEDIDKKYARLPF